MIEERDLTFRPDYAIPPGETIREILESGRMTQAELARRLDRDPVNLNEVIQGNKAITLEMALRLETVLRVPAYFWVNLQSQYEEAKARIAREAKMKEEVELAKKFPYAEMAKLGWVPQTKDWKNRVRILQSYFAVSSLVLVPRFHEAAYRTSRTKKSSPDSLAAWLRRGEIEAQQIDTKPYSEARLHQSITQFRQLTRERPETFEPRLKEICASCGIALVFLPHLKKTYAHGATKWLRPDKALLIVTIRYAWADICWFSLFHEIGHILRHKKRAVFIEYDKMERSKEELEADKFASETLIPTKGLATLRTGRFPTRQDITALANQLEVAPGIVVGRLQHENIIPRSHYNDLREQFCWARNETDREIET